MWLLYVLFASSLFVFPTQAHQFPWNCTEIAQPCTAQYSTTLTSGDASGFYFLNRKGDNLVNLTITPLTNTGNDYIYYLYITQVCPKPGNNIPFTNGNVQALPGQGFDYVSLKVPADPSTYLFVLLYCNNLFLNCDDQFQVCETYYSQ